MPLSRHNNTAPKTVTDPDAGVVIRRRKPDDLRSQYITPPPIRSQASPFATDVFGTSIDTMPATSIENLDAVSPISSVSAFTPRSYPPAPLAEVPFLYVVNKLRELAGQYWNRPETSDCTIFLPVPRNSPPPADLAAEANFNPLGRRATEPIFPTFEKMIFKTHTDYLACHSVLVRRLLSGVSYHSVDIIGNSKEPSSDLFMTSPPRVMPSSTNTHPVLYLPMPDPTSFPFILRWMYFGDSDLIISALDEDVIHWKGLVMNAQYLGMSAELPSIIEWWIKSRYSDDEEEEDSDMDSDFFSSEEDSDFESNNIEGTRGRTREIRGLSSSR